MVADYNLASERKISSMRLLGFPTIILLVYFVVALFSLTARDAWATKKLETIKAAFVYNIIGFTDWPKTNKFSRIEVCVIGEADPIIPYLEAISKSAKAKVKFDVSPKGRDSRIDGCQVVYVGQKHKRDVEYMIGKTEGLPILTVSDVKGFAERGGMIGMVESGGQVKLHGNITAIKKASITVDSELLELMKIHR